MVLQQIRRVPYERNERLLQRYRLFSVRGSLAVPEKERMGPAEPGSVVEAVHWFFGSRTPRCLETSSPKNPASRSSRFPAVRAKERAAIITSILLHEEWR